MSDRPGVRYFDAERGEWVTTQPKSDKASDALKSLVDTGKLAGVSLCVLQACADEDSEEARTLQSWIDALPNILSRLIAQNAGKEKLGPADK